MNNLHKSLLSDRTQNLVDKFIKVANDFENTHIEWFNEQPLVNEYRKTIHDHYILAWNDLGVQFGIKKDSEMPQGMQDALLVEFQSINPDDGAVS